MLNAVANTMSEVIHRVDFIFAASSRMWFRLIPVNNGVSQRRIRRVRTALEP